MASPDPLRRVIDAAAEGDDVAVARLVRETQPAVWRLCHNLGSGDTEDLVQETYLRALKALGSYRGEAPVQAWMLAIARRVCADQVRKRTRQRRLLGRLTSYAEAPLAPPADGSLESLVRLLPEERREAFVLTQLVGLTYDEAAAVLGCAVGTIRSRVARARAELVELVRRAESG